MSEEYKYWVFNEATMQAALAEYLATRLRK